MDAVAKERSFHRSWVNNFLKTVKMTGNLAEDLRKTGYEPSGLARCPAPVFVNMLSLVRRHLFPDLPLAEGYRRVGRLRLASHVERGVSGKLWAKTFPFIGPERVIQGLAKSGSAGNDFMEIGAIQEGDRRWRITFRNTAGVPGEFVAGSLEYALELARTPPERKVVVANADPAEQKFDLEVTW